MLCYVSLSATSLFVYLDKFGSYRVTNKEKYNYPHAPAHTCTRILLKTSEGHLQFRYTEGIHYRERRRERRDFATIRFLSLLLANSSPFIVLSAAP